jgi:nucleotide-binding universal stress UspA family protein
LLLGDAVLRKGTTMAFTKILVACDFSAPASHGLDMALVLAKALGAKLEVVHVHPEPYDGRGDAAVTGVSWPAPGQAERYLRFIEDELRRVVREKDPEAAEKVVYHALRGNPAGKVLDLAKEIGADLICVGSTGKGAVERIMLGSTSQTLLRESLVPVLVAH